MVHMPQIIDCNYIFIITLHPPPLQMDMTSVQHALHLVYLLMVLISDVGLAPSWLDAETDTLMVLAEK